MLWLHHRVPSSCFLISVLMGVVAAEFSKSKIYDSLVLRSFGSLWNIWFSTWSVVTWLLLLNGSNVSIGKGVKFSSRYSDCGVKVFMNASAASEIDNSLAKDEAIVSGRLNWHQHIFTFKIFPSFMSYSVSIEYQSISHTAHIYDLFFFHELLWCVFKAKLFYQNICHNVYIYDLFFLHG